MGDDLFDQADSQCLFGVDDFTGENQAHRPPDADELGEISEFIG